MNEARTRPAAGKAECATTRGADHRARLATTGRAGARRCAPAFWLMLVGVMLCSGCYARQSESPPAPAPPSPVAVDLKTEDDADQQTPAAANPRKPKSAAPNDAAARVETPPRVKSPASPVRPAEKQPTPGQPVAVKASHPTEGTPPEAMSRQMVPSPQPSTGHPAEAETPAIVPKPPASLQKPEVVMTQGHGETCLVKVGDMCPDQALPDLSAQTHLLSSLRGPKLTVVVFWSAKQALGRDQFRRLRDEVYLPFRGMGVNVIAVNVGDADDVVRQACEQAKVKFPCLLDKEKTAFAAVATAKLPRTYLLDGAGRILWMDIEYSRSTRRELVNAIYFYLQTSRDGSRASS